MADDRNSRCYKIYKKTMALHIPFQKRAYTGRICRLHQISDKQQLFFERVIISHGRLSPPLLREKTNRKTATALLQTSFPATRQFQSAFIPKSKNSNIPENTILKMLKIWKEVYPGYIVHSQDILGSYNHPEINSLIINSLETYASAGDIDSLLHLGLIYENGENVEKNLPKALSYYEHAWNILKKQTSIGNLYGSSLFHSYHMRWIGKLLEFYLNSDPSIANIDKAEQFIQDYQDFEFRIRYFFRFQNYSNFFEGIKYDKGLGVQQDHGKAQQIYEHIFNDPKNKQKSYVPLFKSILKEINSCYQEP